MKYNSHVKTFLKYVNEEAFDFYAETKDLAELA